MALEEAPYTTLNSNQGSSFFATVANAVKAVLGAGILTLSWAFYFSSLWPGIVCSGVLCMLSAYTFYLLGVSSELTGHGLYGSIWSRVFGTKWAWLPDLVIVVFCGTCAISCMIVVGDFLPRGLSSFSACPMSRNSYILLASIIVFPFSFSEDLSALGFTSVVGNISTFYTCFLMLFSAWSNGIDADWEPWELQPGICVTIPTLAFTFNGHFNAPALYQQLNDGSPKRWLRVTLVTYGLCFPFLLVCSISGYLMLGSSLNLPNRSDVLTAPIFDGRAEVMVAYIAMTLSVVFIIPIYIHSVRNALKSLWLRDVAPMLNYKAATDSPGLRHTLSALCFGSIVLVALSVNNLGLTVAVNGAMCATLLMYVFPALMYLKCNPKPPATEWWSKRGLPVTVAALGTMVGLAGVITIPMVGMGMSSELRW